MRNIGLILTYLGTAYHGWQVQKNLPTVAETLEKAAAMIVGHPVHMTGCGRTDAGVHAERYVANFRTDSTIPADRLPYALNTHLPCDIVVTKAFDVHENFNAIGSCVKKEYTYQIYNSRLKDPFYVNRAWFYPRHLDETVMQAAADQFVGTHDFAAVRSVGTETRTTVRTVHYFTVERTITWLVPWPAPWSTRRKGKSARRKSVPSWNPETAPPPDLPCRREVCT